jgi:hypothetical protein
MFSDDKRKQLSENLVEKETLVESSSNERKALYEQVRTPEIPKGGERSVILRNYIRNLPAELSDD